MTLFDAKEVLERGHGALNARDTFGEPRATDRDPHIKHFTEMTLRNDVTMGELKAYALDSLSQRVSTLNEELEWGRGVLDPYIR